MSAEVAEECVESGGGGSRGHHSTLLVEWGGALGGLQGPQQVVQPSSGGDCPTPGGAGAPSESTATLDIILRQNTTSPHTSR